MSKYQLLTSSHHDLTSKKEYKRGDIIKSPLDLVSMFPNKWKKVGELPIPDANLVDADLDELVAERRQAKIKAQLKDDINETRKGVGTEKTEDARGKEVTAKFDVETGFHVYQRDTKFHIYKGTSSKPINDKGLKEGSVETFLTSYLEE